MDSQTYPPKHQHETLFFPENFLWGAATSAHQVEGNNTLNDWWAWEQKVQPPEKRSGQAADEYHSYEKDFDLAEQLSHNCHRLSVEWSRIEPEEGQFNEAEIEHYVQVLKALKKRDLTVMLTLHHFTNPLWFAKKGGWENFASPWYFERFVKEVVPYFKDFVDLWITINEPGVITWQSYLAGVWPPQKKSKLGALKVMWNLARSHKRAYQTIHQIIPSAKVGLAHNVMSLHTYHQHSLREAIVKWAADLISNHLIYFLTGKKTHDFLGLNYYFNQYISFNGHTKIPKVVDISVTKKDVTDMGWEIYPEGIFNILMDFSDYHLPIYITENGIATTNDDRRVRFLLSYLKEVYHAISAGANVKGYFHWSLIDNFEWADGFRPRFGLIEVDYKNQSRTPRPSASVFAEIIRNNGIPHYLLKLLGHGTQVSEVLAEARKNLVRAADRPLPIRVVSN